MVRAQKVLDAQEELKFINERLDEALKSHREALKKINEDFVDTSVNMEISMLNRHLMNDNYFYSIRNLQPDNYILLEGIGSKSDFNEGKTTLEQINNLRTKLEEDFKVFIIRKCYAQIVVFYSEKPKALTAYELVHEVKRRALK
jgi:hypothetical protein